MNRELVAEVRTLVQLYQAQMARAWPGDENETLDKLENVCNAISMSVEDAFEMFS